MRFKLLTYSGSQLCAIDADVGALLKRALTDVPHPIEKGYR